MRQIVLLRGINIGSRNRIAMPALRELLTGAGFPDVRTYLQSGNVVLESTERPDQLARTCRRLIAEELGVEVEVITRTRADLAKVVKRNPLHEVARDPKRYQVTFLAEPLAASAVRELAALATASERFVAAGRELYAWHPDGVARSKLWNRLASPKLGVAATSRNWTTVTALLALAKE